MKSLFLILLYLWIAITAMMLVTWYLRKRASNVEEAVDPEAPKVELSPTTGKMGIPQRTPAVHPALVGVDNDGDDSKTDSEAKASSPVSTETPMGTTTTDTIDVVVLGDDQTKGDAGIDEDRSSAQDNNVSEEMDSSPHDNSDASVKDDVNDDVDSALDEMVAVDGAPSLPELSAAPSLNLIDMMDGIRLPYDLTPVTSAVEDPDRHLIFLTTHSNAKEVGTRFVDELIGIGYDFEPVGLDQGIARRGEDTVSMTIVPKASEVSEGGNLRYGAAGPGDVALELWIGEASTPPRAP